jgi:methyl-accepting chemotaxis protein
MKWNVGTKIGTGFALALAILIAIGTVAYRTTATLTENSRQVTHTHQVIESTGRLTAALIDQETGERGYIIAGDTSYLEPYQTGLADGEKAFQTLRTLTKENPRHQARLDRLAPLIKARQDRLQGGIDVRREKGLEAGLAWISSGIGKRSMDDIRAILNEMEQEENGLLQERAAEAQASARMTTLTITLGTLGAILLLGFVSVTITRNIAGPLGNVSEMAGRIATGDLAVSIPVTSRSDEVGVLMRTFSRMIESLNGVARVAERVAAGDLRGKVQPQSERDMLGNALATMVANLQRLTGELAEGVTVLSTSAGEISTSTTQFAASATETATAVGETTTTVEEVRQTAQVSSQKAKAVSEVAQRVSQISQSGKRATEETASGIGRIREQMESIAGSMVRLSEQSQAIGQIVTTVEDLAAQSNLLAVNAAIEAAKAGEHGRGFAIVAQEVKSLAEQSKQATGQVRSILNDIQKATSAAVLATEQGSKAVEAGVKLSAEAGQSIQTLTGNVSDAAQAAAQIAASSQQQLVGVDQVASAMENIRQASAQNADSARQLESAAHNLKALGEKLKQMIEHYKI